MNHGWINGQALPDVYNWRNKLVAPIIMIELVLFRIPSTLSVSCNAPSHILLVFQASKLHRQIDSAVSFKSRLVRLRLLLMFTDEVD